MDVEAEDFYGIYESDAMVPRTRYSAGIDLRAACFEPVTLWPGEVTRVPFGVKLWVDTEEPYVGLLALRSSVAMNGVMLVNGVGIIDQDYRGELAGLLTCISTAYTIQPGARIAQIVFLPRLPINGSHTLRREGGFGSTG